MKITKRVMENEMSMRRKWMKFDFFVFNKISNVLDEQNQKNCDSKDQIVF